jgi:ABC-type multidrug transport system ATPase subunit
LGVLSVRETIKYALRLSVAANPAKKWQIDQRVTEIIASLGLSSVEHNRIGTSFQRGISGGQKRRVTIGTSLVTSPSVSLSIVSLLFNPLTLDIRSSFWTNQRLASMVRLPAK